MVQTVDLKKVNDLLLNEDLGTMNAYEAIEFATAIIASAYFNLSITSTEEQLFASLETNASIKQKVLMIQQEFYKDIK